jgi:hypothetical protein
MWHLEIAGISVDLACSSVELLAELHPRYAAFLTDDCSRNAFALVVDVVRPVTEGVTRFAVDPGLAVSTAGGSEARLSVTGNGLTGYLDLEAGEGRVRLSRTSGITLEYLIRILYAYLAFRSGGVLLHAAGLAHETRAYLFIGQSGSGKSTVTALSPWAAVLGDDLVIARPDERIWVAQSTPFWNPDRVGRSPQPAEALIVGIYKLVKAGEVRLEPLSLSVATAELAANCPVLNADPAKLGVLVDRCRTLAHAVPVRALHFRKEPSFWPVLWPRDAVKPWEVDS